MNEEIQVISIDKIAFRPQVRELFNETLIAGLAANIEEVGQEYPVLLFEDGDKYGIEDGERRCRALKSLGRKSVAAIVKEKPSEAMLLLRQCSVDFQREELSPMEKASAMERLMKATGWSCKEVATKLGVSPATVSRLLSLLSLPEPIRQVLKDGKIPASAGFELAKIDDAALQRELVEKLIAGGMTRDGVAEARKAAKRQGGESPVKRATAVLEGGRSVSVSASNLEEFISALEETLSKARKGRTQGLGLDTFLRLLKDQSA